MLVDSWSVLVPLPLLDLLRALDLMATLWGLSATVDHFPKGLSYNTSTATTYVGRILFRRNVMPFHTSVGLDLGNAVGNELAIFSLTIDPVERYCGVQPAMDRRD